MDDPDPLNELLFHLFLLSFLAIGGINVILPELHRVTVLSGAWMSEEEFTALFALAQATPGPNMLFVTLIGWHAGGIPGGLLATLAMSLPTGIIAYGMARLWMASGHRPWFTALRQGLAPLTVGLMIASAWLLTVASAVSWVSYAITAVTALVIAATRIHPILILAAAGGIGAAGLV